MKRVIVLLGVALLLAGCATARKPATLDVPKPQPAPVAAPAAQAPAPRVPVKRLMPIETQPIIAPPAPAAPAPAPAPAPYVEPTPAPVPYVTPSPEPVYYDPVLEDGGCAKPTDRGETDGGYGGTGLAPEDCPPEA